MTDKKFTDEEIINYLTEILIASTNGYSEHLANGGRIDKSQEQWLEMLTEIINIINRQKSEIERLKTTIDSFTDIGKLYSEIKAEAYKEFAERLKETSGLRAGCVPWYEIHAEIDYLLKEMVGEDE